MTQRETTTDDSKHSIAQPPATYIEAATMPHMQILLLGALIVVRDQLPIQSFPSDKVRALLALLATEPHRPHTRSSLVALLWPDQPETLALRNLSQTLVRLRRTIGDTSDTSPLIIITRATLQWNNDSNTIIDLARFTQLCKSRAPHDLAEAVEWYRGDFLAGFNLSGCAAFEEWQTITREHLRQSMLTALHTLTEATFAVGKLAASERYARQQVALDPWREEAHRQVMRVLAASGQRAAAMAHYNVCQKLLRDELGIAPDPSTTTLFNQIAAGQVVQAVARTDVSTLNGPASRAEPSAAIRSSLPTVFTPLLGRADEVAELVELLQPGNERLVTIVGQGGVGKTHLAATAAQHLQQTFADGVCWVSLAGIAASTPDHVSEVTAALVSALGLPINGPEDLSVQCIRMLSQRDLLIVLDNMEHLLGGTAFVLQLLQSAPKVRMLVTSRERLDITAEYVLPLSGLAVPAHENARDAATYSAVSLFVERAQRHARGFGQDAATLRAIVRLCHILDGLPLGIELAARWVAHFSCDEITRAITINSEFLTTTARDYPARHRSLRAVFTYSWDLLAPKQQQALMRLSVFHGAFDRAAAQTVTEASAETLVALIDSSMLRRLATGRYVMHELLRQFAAEQLSVHEPDQLTPARHAVYYLRWTAERAKGLSGPQRHEALTAIEAALENVQAAWVWAVDHDDYALLTEAIDGVCAFYDHRGRYHEGYAACQRVITRLDTTPPVDMTRLVLGQALAWQAAFAITLLPLPQAHALLERSLSLINTVEGQHVRAFVVCSLGRVAFLESDLTKAKELLAQSLDLYQACNDQVGAAVTLGMLGRLAWLMGDYARSHCWYAESLAIYRARDDRMGSVKMMSDLAMVTVLEGRSAEGTQLFEASHLIINTLSDPLEIAQARRQLGNAMLNVGHYAAAQSQYEHCLALTDDYARSSLQISDRLMLSFIYLMQRQYHEVTTLAQAAFTAARALNLQRDTGFAVLMLGLAELGRQNYVQARAQLQECLAMYQLINTADDQSFTLFGLSLAHRALGDVHQARQAAKDALQLAVQRRSARAAGIAVGAWIGVLANEHDLERAIELEVLVMRHPSGANSGFFHDLITQPLASSIAHIPADVIAAARARGAVRSFPATLAELQGL